MLLKNLPKTIATLSILTVLTTPATLADTKRLLLVGPTGVGKSTLINAIYNATVKKTDATNCQYITRIQEHSASPIPPLDIALVQDYSDFVTETCYCEAIPRENRQSLHPCDSDTGAITGYRFQPNFEGWHPNDDLEIIDAPGLDDTEGESTTRMITEQINTFLTQYPDHLSAIGIVFNATEKRDRPSYTTIFNQIKQLFPQDVVDRIFILTNFSQTIDEFSEEIERIIARGFSAIPKEQYFPTNVSYIVKEVNHLKPRQQAQQQAYLQESERSIHNLLRHIGQLTKPMQTSVYQDFMAVVHQDAHALYDYLTLFSQKQETQDGISQLEKLITEVAERKDILGQCLTRKEV